MREFHISEDTASKGSSWMDWDFRDASLRHENGAFQAVALRAFLRQPRGGGSFAIMCRRPTLEASNLQPFELVATLPADTPLEEAKEATLNFLRLGMDLNH